MRLIVIAGAPGTGKSTLARRLFESRRCPWIDYGNLRQFHLLPDWSNQSREEEQMTFENLLAIIRNYWRYGYTEVLVDDLRDHRVVELPQSLPEAQVDILTLTTSDPEVLRRRIAQRNDGWKNQDAAVAWNQSVLERGRVQGEARIDVTVSTQGEVFQRASALLGSPEQ